MYMTGFCVITSILVLLCKTSVLSAYSAAQKFHSAKQSQKMVGFLLKPFSKIKKKVFFVTDKIKVKRVRIMFSSTDYIRLFYTSGFAT